MGADARKLQQAPAAAPASSGKPVADLLFVLSADSVSVPPLPAYPRTSVKHGPITSKVLAYSADAFSRVVAQSMMGLWGCTGIIHKPNNLAARGSNIVRSVLWIRYARRRCSLSTCDLSFIILDISFVRPFSDVGISVASYPSFQSTWRLVVLCRGPLRNAWQADIAMLCSCNRRARRSHPDP